MHSNTATAAAGSGLGNSDMNKTLSTLILSAALLLPAVQATAATVVPGDFDRIFTEGKRTSTVDGANVSGHAARNNNGDVGLFDIGGIAAGEAILLVGRVVRAGSDRFVAGNVSGLIDIAVVNYAESSRKGLSPFKAAFELRIDGALTQTVVLEGQSADILDGVFTPFVVNNQTVEFRVRSQLGRSDYDAAIFSRVASGPNAVPAPAALPLLLSAFAGLAVLGARRRKRRG